MPSRLVGVILNELEFIPRGTCNSRRFNAHGGKNYFLALKSEAVNDGAAEVSTLARVHADAALLFTEQ
jgi:hypothetical protein